MIAIEISSFGPADVLRPVERPKPAARAGEIVIRVEAAGVARADVMQRLGKYPPPAGASDIPGLDVAGTIDSIGSGVRSHTRYASLLLSYQIRPNLFLEANGVFRNETNEAPLPSHNTFVMYLWVRWNAARRNFEF